MILFWSILSGDTSIHLVIIFIPILKQTLATERAWPSQWNILVSQEYQMFFTKDQRCLCQHYSLEKTSLSSGMEQKLLESKKRIQINLTIFWICSCSDDCSYSQEMVSARLESRFKICVASIFLFVTVQHLSEFTTDLILL